MLLSNSLYVYIVLRDGDHAQKQRIAQRATIMRLSFLASSVALLNSSVAHAAPIISGNHHVSNEAINQSLGQGKPANINQAARIILDLYH
ncbi:hypothetical protein [Pseudomonas sp. Leaf58]|uniref:hypothetical protein n=1 Tax=Pseudomonas sp. Leaf58 TaxID=1736226 RepID=UPI00138F086B|nr:hypothetical protein [Pseudomonas sp. Leaf58]